MVRSTEPQIRSSHFTSSLSIPPSVLRSSPASFPSPSLLFSFSPPNLLPQIQLDCGYVAHAHQTCVIKYNLVLVEGRWCSEARKVTAGMPMQGLYGTCQRRIQSKGGSSHPILAPIFFPISHLFPYKRHSWLCSFAIKWRRGWYIVFRPLPAFQNFGSATGPCIY